ncbi:MAG: hypothetical protein DRN49_03300 [Thaumarchaeota archaeon]|nr:MAG: hypothetical protein DRN49_03300 [Nitrososphaerota archaeon]
MRYASGMSPLVFEWHRLGPLKEKGLYRHVRDKDMLRVVPEQEEDSHIGNLAATVGAKVIVMRNKKSAPTLRQTYGLPVVSLKEFLDCM